MAKTSYKNGLTGAIVEAHKNGNKVLVCGNGGLCATGEHVAAEFVGKYAFDVYVPCIALTTNTSLITALANDIGFEDVFAHQIKILGNKGDVLIAMTTSRSPNVVRAIEQARKQELIVAVICGKESGGFDAEYVYKMKGGDTAEIQDRAMEFLHVVAYEVKRRLVEGGEDVS